MRRFDPSRPSQAVRAFGQTARLADKGLRLAGFRASGAFLDSAITSGAGRALLADQTISRAPNLPETFVDSGARHGVSCADAVRSGDLF